VAVKQLQTLQRGLAVMEAVAEHHPIGLTELARLLEEDKSAMQRVLETLDATGWITPSRQEPARWVPTSKAFLITMRAQRRSHTLQRIRPLLERLRDKLGETAFYVVLERDELVIIDVVESRHISRVAPHPGLTLAADESAAKRAMATPGSWAGDTDVVGEGTTSVAVAIFETGQPTGAIVVSAPSVRMSTGQRDDIGRALVEETIAEFPGV
jgi:IclR family acetate operon transcriptional repressor